MSRKTSGLAVPGGERVVELADILPVKIAIIGSDSVFRFVNQTFVDWLGMARNDIIGAKVPDILRRYGDDSESERRALIEDVIATGETRRYEVEIEHPSLGMRIMDATVSPHESGDAIYAFFRDCTEARASAVIAAKFQAVFDTASDGIIVIDDGGIIQSFNKAAEELFGYSSAQVIGQNITTLMPPSYAEAHPGHIARYLETRNPHIIGKSSVEAECLRRDGTTFPADLAVATFEDRGRTYFTGVIRNITERKLYDASLRQNEEDLEAEVQRRGRTLDRIFALSSDVLGIVGFDGHFQTVSPSIQALIGTSVHPSSRQLVDYIHPDDRADFAEAIAKAISGTPVISHEARICNQEDCTTRWASWSVQPVIEDRVLLMVGRDVTEDKMREEKLRQAQKMEAIGQLTGGIAHDFNNLLAAISGSLEMMEKRFTTGKYDQIPRYIEAGKQASWKAAQLTQRLLAFARRQPLAPVPVETNVLLDSMRDLCDRSIGPSIRLKTKFDNDLWKTICDPNQLESGMLNCVINARDAMPDGGTITVETTNVPENLCRLHDIPRGEYVLVAISDTGTGMPQHVVERAFDPFFTTKPIGQGTGLGLSMLYGFVNQSNGHVKINSKVDSGTTIKVFLPRFVGEIIPAIVEERKDLTKIATPGQTILVVEDEELVRGVLVELMETCGFNTIQAGSADQAIPYLSSDMRIDLLLSDVGLPGMNGRQLAEVARQYRPEIKVLFVTGFAPNAMVRDTFLDKGMDMMTKPFEVDAVASRVARMLNQ